MATNYEVNDYIDISKSIIDGAYDFYILRPRINYSVGGNSGTFLPYAQYYNYLKVTYDIISK